MPDVSITVLNYNTPHATIACVESIIKYSRGFSYEILIVENGSQDNSYEHLSRRFKKQQKVKIIKVLKNKGFGAGHNSGIRQAKGTFLLLLSSDILLFENSIPMLINEYKRLIKKTKIGFIQPRLYHNLRQKRVQQTCSAIPTVFQIIQESISPFRAVRTEQFRAFRYLDWDRNSSRFADTVCGAALFCRRDFFEKLGLFDERFYFYFEEYDLAKRGKKRGYKNYFTTSTSLIHTEGIWAVPWIYKKLLYFKSFIQFLLKKY